MSKRFTDTDKWKKPFIRGLEGAYKLLWFYILDDCDHAGIWHVDLEVASIRTGTSISYLDAQEKFGNHIIPFDNNEKWFIPDFIEFQYGKLNPVNRVHNSALKQLEKYNLIDKEGHVSPLQGVKDKDKDKKKDKDKDCYRKFKHLSILNSEVEELKKTYSIGEINSILDAIENYRKNTNYVSLYQTAIVWLKKDHNGGDTTGRRITEPIKNFKYE